MVNDLPSRLLHPYSPLKYFSIYDVGYFLYSLIFTENPCTGCIIAYLFEKCNPEALTLPFFLHYPIAKTGKGWYNKSIIP